MKKIVLFSSSGLIYGSERGLINMIRELKGESLYVVVPKRGPLEEKIRLISPEARVKVFPLPVLKNSLSIIYYPWFIILSFINIIYFVVFIIFNKIDLVCTNNLLLPTPGISAKLASRPHLWFIRENHSSKTINKILYSIAGIFADRIIFQSKNLENKFGKTSKSRVIYEPLNRDDYRIYQREEAFRRLGLDKNLKIIALISRIHPSKGQLEFIRSMESYIKNNKSILLLIIGDITPKTFKNSLYRKNILKTIKTGGLNNVILKGFMEDVGLAISASDICVFPFKKEEPFGIAVAECLAFGKPVFYPYTGGLKEIREIFNKGYDYNIKHIKEYLESLKGPKTLRLNELFIPDVLSWENYSRSIKELII